MTEHNEEEQRQVSQSATEQQQQQQPNPEEDEEHEEFKIYIGRVPTKFTEDTVKRILVDKLGGEAAAEGGNGGDDDAAVVVAVAVVEKVELIYPHDDETGDNHNHNHNNKNKNHPEGYRADRAGGQTNHDKRETTTKDDANANANASADKEHRGFGFVSFSTAAFRDAALKLGTIKGGRKRTSKRLYTMHLRPYVPIADANADANAEPSENGRGESDALPTGRDVCHLWSLKRCPYGNECKFRHVGEGGCLRREEDLTPEEQKQLRRKRKGKCFVYKKKGRCPKGDDCPFSHDFEPDVKARTGDSETKSGSGGGACVAVDAVPKSEKDCINWKTKGKCRKGDKCPYKHDPEVQKRALEKIAKKKKRQRDGEGDGDDANANANDQKRRRKEKQPLSVRVFGLNYDTTEKDVREFVESLAGHPVKTIVFPRFEDSGRSKGYCGVYFASPKAAKDAVAKCDGAELQGRWLRVQTGKSMTVDQWEGLHHK